MVGASRALFGTFVCVCVCHHLTGIVLFIYLHSSRTTFRRVREYQGASLLLSALRQRMTRGYTNGTEDCSPRDDEPNGTQASRTEML